ncbi:MAG: CoA pyrophosphatase [Acidimicrobiales bacterium]
MGRVVATIRGATPYDPEVVSVQGKPPSAVLVPLVDGPNGVEIVMARRSWNMRTHVGEVSFPGGRMDPTDRSLLETALRETEEEIGLSRAHVEIVGQLDPLATVSSPSLIVPFVGTIDTLPTLTPSPDEVDGIIHVSLAELLDPAIYREEIWTRDGVEMPITFFELVGDTLGGATARMVRNLLELLVDVEPTGRGYG